MKRSRVAVPVVLVLLAAGIAGLVWWYGRPAGTDSDSLTLYGNVELRDAELAFIEQERVAEVLVEEGQAVERGQLLARLARELLDAQLAEAAAQLTAEREALRRLTNGTRPQEIEQAEARLQAAVVRASNAERLVRRLEETTATGASTEQELDDARSR
ncbi:MAG TPA: biotin/lipoyl-binding protein, partial [Candidatus Polarisedimenticolaceae bacterium]|nr:biotin/lipoyl-binding protein [Candidatus Polarisedimenticolaceae bacterium]